MLETIGLTTVITASVTASVAYVGHLMYMRTVNLEHTRSLKTQENTINTQREHMFLLRSSESELKKELNDTKTDLVIANSRYDNLNIAYGEAIAKTRKGGLQSISFKYHRYGGIETCYSRLGSTFEEGKVEYINYEETS
ncbi:MAG: hypothetical protein ACRDC4_16010, partial [Plesiomonas sp.]